MSAGPVITVDSVSKRFRLYHERNQSLKASVMRRRRARYEEFWALKEVSFEVPEGSTFGLIGENGSGKSTLLKCIARILRPDGGSISTRGKLSALLELGAGFHQELTGRENVYLNGAILGLTKRQLDARFDDIVAFAGIEQFIDTPVKNYSSGMYVRLGFSVAINVDPDILLVDEVLAVGDAEFQRKCSEKIAEFHKQGKTIVLVSHTLPTVRALCDEVALLDHGALVDIGTPGHIIDHYLADTFSDASHDGGLVRWGSGEVRVERVEMLDASGASVSRAQTGDEVTFRFHYQARDDVRDAILGFAVHTVTGTEVTGPNVRHAGLECQRMVGHGYVDYRIPRCLLLPGAYDLVAAIYDFSGSHPYDHVQNALRFEIDAGTPYEENGLVSLGGEWSGDSLRVIEARKQAG
jgi:ABC-2 type transport system ATP-binding protein